MALTCYVMLAPKAEYFAIFQGNFSPKMSIFSFSDSRSWLEGQSTLAWISGVHQLSVMVILSMQ